MRSNPFPLIAVLLLCSFFSAAQNTSRYKLSLNSGEFIPVKNIDDIVEPDGNQRTAKAGVKSFLIIQFENIPTIAERKELKDNGIDLQEYVPNNAFTAVITGAISKAALKKAKARAVVELTPEQKMEPSLAKGIFPNRATKTAGALDLWISFPKAFSFEAVKSELSTRNIDIVSELYQQYRIINIRIAANRLREIAALPFVEYVQASPKEDEVVNDKSTVNARANILQSVLPGGRNLTGKDIVVGVGDDSNPMNHIDYSGRIINRMQAAGGSHGAHVIGTLGGAGIVEEKQKGYAPKATIISQYFSNILAYAPLYVQDYGMVITNNSYGNIVNDCATFGVYTLSSRILDQQAFQLPSLQHVFAAGNSGSYNCAPYVAGFSNVLGDYQTAKNVITVGNNAETGLISNSSSKGPVRDGRIKPEITAQGSRVYSTIPVNGYNYNSGTSMASPAVSGGLALLYQRYKQLHGNINPGNALMKALLCNGATDLGNPGPDYSYGFGWMNLERSVKMLENNDYLQSNVNSGATNTHTIVIPSTSNIARLKVMLYWNDSAAAALASTALINDLDLSVTDFSAAVFLPQLLNHTPANVTQPAITGADHINNIEQVVIDNPVAGTSYTVSVKGTTIPSGGQHGYVLVFDTLPVSTALTYPRGGEHLKNADSIYISWDAYGNTANDFTLQYSIDNGMSWSPIVANIAANLRQYKWFLPAVATSQARVKLIHNGTGIESISDTFTIVGIPVVSLSPIQCEGYINLTWPAITGATDYEVMILRDNEMQAIGDTTGTSYTISGLSKDSLYWVAVRARVNGGAGRRSTAISRQPNGGTCAGSISDNDLKADAIISPASTGRKFTSTELSATQTITIRIKNLDDQPTTGDIPVSYKLGTNPAVIDTIIAPNIAGGASFDYSFTTTANLSATGIYPLQVTVSYANDTLHTNDTLRKTYRQLDNIAINLTSNFIDNIETAAVQAYTSKQIGLTGLDRYDFVTSSPYGQIRSFINSGIAYSGNRALTLDADRYNGGGTTDSLTGTFNLQGYNSSTEDIRLDFMYKQHGQLANAANNVWIRGNDSLPWVKIYDLYANQEAPGIFKKSASIEMSDILVAASQNYSGSFQVRWGQWGQTIATDDQTAAGYTFDDVRLYKVSDDMQMIRIDTPVTASCGLGSAVPVTITVRNSTNAIVTSIPVKYSVDNGAPVTEFITAIGVKDSIHYTFTTTANLSANGLHTIKAWVDLPSDNYADNDTAFVRLYNSPVISSFPSLQNFEADNGFWYTEGKNSSWQYGTPSSPKINRAASGSKAWKTGIAGNYNDGEKSYLYSPCYDITGLTAPTLSFSVALDLEDCGASICDAAYAEYSQDGKTWVRLGANGAGTNWYNKAYAGNNVWSVQDYTRWHVATIPLPTGISRLRLRFVMESDPFVNREGIAIDDIHVYSNTKGIYETPPNISAVSNQPAVSGTGWIDFTDGGKLIASVNPNGQNLGNTNAQAFIHTGAVRTSSGQYYHNRNITITPTNVNLTDSASVRFYFLDSETETLINATGCSLCSKPSTAYALGVSKYSDTNIPAENGTIADNTSNNWLFISPANVAKVPFDKGYYAEFKVKNFSEFWLNNGGINNNQALPIELSAFTAKKIAGNDVKVEWQVATEINVNRYEIEMANGNTNYTQNMFNKIGEITSRGNSTTTQLYQFMDAENNKSGVRYYRLKIIDQDGSFTYSAVRPVFFTSEVKWQVYPNPSAGIFNLVYQMNEGETAFVNVYDVNGKLITQVSMAANGFVQKMEIDLSGPKYARGMYLLQLTGQHKKELFRLLKH